MNKILVVTNGESDLLRLLRANCDITVISSEAVFPNADAFDALCVLAGNESAPLNLSAPLQWGLNRMREMGKPVLCEFLGTMGATMKRSMVSTERQRMVYYASGLEVRGLNDGDLLDGQSNDCIKHAPYECDSSPILTYQEPICAHSNAQIGIEKHREGTWALWWLDKSTLVSSIRLCNFHRARFAPRARWQVLITDRKSGV